MNAPLADQWKRERNKPHRTDRIGIYDVARNRGTSAEMIRQYYGKQATPKMMATTFGGKFKDRHKMNER